MVRVAIVTDNVYDEDGSNWLKSTVVIPLEALGVKLIEQEGPPVESPMLFTMADVTCSPGKYCDLFLLTSLSRKLQLPDDTSVRFRADVWRKEHRERALEAGNAKARIKELLTADVNEFVRYWAMANSDRRRD